MREAREGQETVEQRRILLANKPRLLRGMLRRVLAMDPELDVVGETNDLSALPEKVDETDADWVVVSLWSDGGESAPLQALLQELASVSVLGVAADGSRAQVRAGGTPDEILEAVSLDELIAVLRSPPTQDGQASNA
jgi:DNA-binding NarL/FixJ family response regulator